MLLKEDKRSNGVRTETNEARHPTTESPCEALLSSDITEQSNNALTAAFSRRSAHDASLDHIDRAADSGSHKSSHEGGREMRSHVIRHAQLLETQALEGIVRGQLRRCHENSTGRVRPHTAEQAGGTFGARHRHQSVNRVAVVTALSGRESGVGLHAHVQNVGGVTSHATDEAGGRGHTDQGEEARRRVGGGEVVFEFLVDTESCGGVGQLAQNGGGQLQEVTLASCTEIDMIWRVGGYYIPRCKDRRIRHS